MKNLELKAERVRNGLTQTDVARKLDISVSAYNAKENGKRRFSSEEISVLIDILKLDYSQFSAIFLRKSNRKDKQNNLQIGFVEFLVIL